MSNELILIVDDNTMNIFALKTIIEKCGFMCDVAYNGKEAVDLQRVKAYELILMDINMPFMDGSEATKILAKMFKERKEIAAPIVAVTATNFNSEEDTSNLLAIGFADIIQKPVRKQDFLRKISYCFV